MPDYEFKVAHELVFAALTAAGFQLLLALKDFDPAVITDWHTWAIAIGGGLVRAAVGGALAAIASLKAG